MLTHPVRWADVRRQALREAADRAGLGDVTLVDEPVAAAIHYAAEHVAVGAHVGVYDLGGGTFDTAVLARTPDGFDVVGVPGGDEHIGGEDFDHRLFRYFGDCIAESSPDVWEQMLTSDERSWKRATLTISSSGPPRQGGAVVVHVDPGLRVGRRSRHRSKPRQFEAMILRRHQRTVDLMEDTVVDAGLRIDDLAAVFLVGGSSRMPLVATLVGERFGSHVVTRDEPKGVVALGAARLAGQLLLPRRPAGEHPAGRHPPRGRGSPPRRRRRRDLHRSSCRRSPAASLPAPAALPAPQPLASARRAPPRRPAEPPHSTRPWPSTSRPHR